MLVLKSLIARFYHLRLYMQHIVDSHYPRKKLSSPPWRQSGFEAPMVFSDDVYHKHINKKVGLSMSLLETLDFVKISEIMDYLYDNNKILKDEQNKDTIALLNNLGLIEYTWQISPGYYRLTTSGYKLCLYSYSNPDEYKHYIKLI